jgi:hypothetical protein
MEKIVAPNKPLPELADYLSSFDKYFIRSEGRESMERYSTGLLSDIPRKNHRRQCSWNQKPKTAISPDWYPMGSLGSQSGESRA